MVFTLYYGLYVESDEVKETTWVRSLQNKGGAIDGRCLGDFTQLENNSLGDIVNHSSTGSVTRYKTLQSKARVSGCLESIVLTRKATRDGDAFTEMTTFELKWDPTPF